MSSKSKQFVFNQNKYIFKQIFTLLRYSNNIFSDNGLVGNLLTNNGI